MSRIPIGKTGLFAEDTGFGALPIQRISRAEAVRLLLRAYDGGVTYFDTARAYSDSEEKVGAAFRGMRDKIILATKTMARDAAGFRADLETSLRTLGTDYIDIYQFHNPPFCPVPGHPSGLWEAAQEALQQGKIRFISITNHRLDVARQAVESGLFATLQFPFSYLSTEKEISLVHDTLASGMGFICMKGLSGGLITSSAAACLWMKRFPGVMPIWGVQRDWELEEFLSYIKNPPEETPELNELIDNDRRQLIGEFCRGCGYCMPCPVGIEINTAARMSLLLRRAPSEANLGEKGQALMNKIDDCLGCRSCASKCPFGLDTPELLKRNLKDYREVLAGKELLPHNF
ncbi:MAG: aldo/keto reductase [Oscillospiraceae bacterium]|nr:aldo/keto reductase [Oscillospiraceae bacterium]